MRGGLCGRISRRRTAWPSHCVTWSEPYPLLRSQHGDDKGREGKGMAGMLSSDEQQSGGRAGRKRRNEEILGRGIDEVLHDPRLHADWGIF